MLSAPPYVAYGYNPLPPAPYQYVAQPSYPVPAQQPLQQPNLQKKHIFNAPPKKSNALFIKNLPYDLPPEEFMKTFESFGEIASSSMHIRNRGIAFVTYYDIRAAEAAVVGLKDYNVLGRHPVIDYSYKPPNYSKIDPRETSSQVSVKSVDASKKLMADSLRNCFIKFGDISEIKEIDNNSTFSVQFFDFRPAHEIAKNESMNIDGILCKVEIYVEIDNSVEYNNLPPSYYHNPPLNQNNILRSTPRSPVNLSVQPLPPPPLGERQGRQSQPVMPSQPIMLSQPLMSSQPIMAPLPLNQVKQVPPPASYAMPPPPPIYQQPVGIPQIPPNQQPPSAPLQQNTNDPNAIKASLQRLKSFLLQKH